MIQEQDKKKKKYKKVVKMSKTERLLYTLAITLLLLAPISVVFSKATLSKLNFEVEEKKREIESDCRCCRGCTCQGTACSGRYHYHRSIRGNQPYADQEGYQT